VIRAIRALAIAAAMLPVLPAGAEEAPDETLVDRVVATVGNTPITASEVALEGAVRDRIAALPRTDREVFGRLLTETREPLAVVVFRAILVETTEFTSVRITDDREAYERFAAFEATFDDRQEARAFRRSWGLTRVALVEYFRVSAVLDHAVELAVDRTVRVTDDDERRYYEENAERMFGGSPIEEVRESVARQVYAQKFDQAYQGWRKRLHAEARLRYLR
jgi:hypothetical protein